MSLHLYLDPELTQQVSEGDMSSPDSDTLDGSSGESKDRLLFVANEQTVLAVALDTIQSVIVIATPRFNNDEVIIIDSEEMRILSGGGTTTLTIQRAIYGTQPAAHSQGAIIYSACNYTNLIVEPVDISGTDESSWCKLAMTQAELDTVEPGEALALGDKSFNATASFWRRITIPPGTSAHRKSDIKLRLSGTLSLA